MSEFEVLFDQASNSGQKYAYTVALTVLRTQPVEQAIDFIQQSLNDLSPKKPEVIEPLHVPLL